MILIGRSFINLEGIHMNLKGMSLHEFKEGAARIEKVSGMSYINLKGIHRLFFSFGASGPGPGH